MGGQHFLDNTELVKTAKRDVQRLADHGLTKESRLLDWGCGAGRLAIGVIETWGGIAFYNGVDVQKDLILWDQRHLARPGIRFTYVNLANARYNPDGSPVLQIPGDDGGYDALYGYSVLSHMDTKEVHTYLAEIRRLLSPNGFAWVTAFVERNVPDEEENPTGYGPLEWKGALHCVRFEQSYFERLIAEAGLRVDLFEHGDETDGQSLYVLRHASGAMP
jgi:ubiquinone/menaquinone biosynthesis C-methylase UbiE